MERPHPRLAWLLLWLPGTLFAAGIYRWQGSDDLPHYGDHPPHSVHATYVPGPDERGRLHRVRRIFDGDTVELDDGVHVRLLGINAPEVAHRENKAQPLGDAATRVLTRLIGDQRVRLGFDRQRHDHYGRLLARLFTPDGKDLDLAMVRAGMAHVSIHPPNLARIPRYLRAETKARAARRGIWALKTFALQPTTRAGHLHAGFHRLRGTVTKVHEGRRYSYLQFDGGFRAMLDAEATRAFVAAGHAPGQLKGATLTVRGWLHRYHGRPEIWLQDPLQVEGLE